MVVLPTEEASHRTCPSQRSLVVATPPELLGRCQHLFCFYIVALELQGSRSAFGWPIFQAMAFLIGLLTGAVVDSEKSSRGPVVLATQRACCHSGAKVLSLPNLSGWSAKPNRGPWWLDSSWAQLLQLSESVSAVDTFCLSFMHCR